jgi:proton glutamate symport protein
MAKRVLNNIGVQVVVAMLLGTLVGAMMGDGAAVFAPLGSLFIHLIMMLVVPLIAISIVAGAAGLGGSPAAGRVGLTTFAFFLLTSGVAVALALFMGVLFQPGSGLDLSAVQEMFSREYADKGEVPGFFATVLGMIPTNVFSALEQGNILQILVFCLFLGIALSRLESAKSAPLLFGLNSVIEAFVWMINVVMRVAPIGVFGLMADAVGTFGFDVLLLVSKLFGVYVLAILLYGFVFYPLVVKTFSDVPVAKFMSRMKKPQVVALSTASSMATLPVTMDTAQRELGLSRSTTAFVLPLGATINMSGNAIYYGLVAMFFAQVFGVELGLSAYLAIIFTATLGAIGQAGVPGPSFLVVAVLLAAGIPVEGLPLLFALDRLFDMIRTSLNITGDAACAAVVDRLVPETAEADEALAAADSEATARA